MSHKIEWSPRATQEYLSLIEYLLGEWGEKSTMKFHARVRSILDTLSEKPEIFTGTTNRLNVRRCVVSKQTSLYYRVNNNKIELITFFDNRKDPSKKKL